MQISPSQVVNALSCRRKWWFKSCHKVGDGKDPTARDVGTILHACAERWLNADDQGRDRETNQPVDPFPPGWERVIEFGKDTGRSLSKMDQALVRVLFRKGVDNGTLRRLPNRKVEDHFVVDVIPGVTMQGYIDQDSDYVVEDHKTTKHKGYALSPAKLHNDDKMLCYAHVRTLRRDPSLANTPVTLRLNYFSKTQDKDPWAVEANVSPEFVRKFWQGTLIPVATEMKALREAKLPVEQWADVPGPQQKGACEDYGGCPYASVCSRITTIERLKATLDRNKQPKAERKKGTMSFFNKTKKAAAASAAPTATPAAATSAAEKTVHAEAVEADMATAGNPGAEVETAEVAEVAVETPPWAVSSCRACKGKGINSKGEPCAACDLVSGRTGGKTSSQYKTWVDDQGMLRWAEAEGADILPEPKSTKKEPAAKGATRTAQTKPKPKEEAAPAVPTPATHINTTIMPPEPAKVGSVMGASAGFDLFIGCMPLNRATIDISEVLAREGEEMARASGKNSFFELDAFARRDAMAAQCRTIAASLQGFALLVPTALSPDEKSLLTALRPLASNVAVVCG